MLRPSSLVLLAAVGCGPPLDGDVALVGVSSAQVDASAATLRVQELLLDDCDGSLTVVPVGGQTDLLSDAPLPRRLPRGEWCGLSVRFDVEEAVVVRGATAAGTPVDATLAPTLVDVDTGSFAVDGDDYVLVLDLDTLVEPEALDGGESGTFGPTDPEASAWEARLPDALWFGRVDTARTTVFVDLWPWPDITFDGGYAGGGAPSGGCRGGVWFDLDGDGIPDVDDDDDDGDGIPDAEDEDADGDGVVDSEDPDRDGDGVADVEDPDGGTGEEPGGGRNDPQAGSAGGGGCSGGGGGCDGGGGGGGCEGGGGCACEADTCSTLGFVPPGVLALFGIIALRRRR